MKKDPVMYGILFVCLVLVLLWACSLWQNEVTT